VSISRSVQHERWLAEKHFQRATFVYDYPAAIKSFYMRGNDADGGEVRRHDETVSVSR
jgi:asparaginyl-tRNA synthetase